MIETLFWSAVGLVAYTYGLFPLVLLARGALLRRPVRIGEGRPRVSVIIAAHDEADRIATKLESVLDLDYPKDRLEVIVVSDGSSDATEQVVQEFGPRGVTLIALPRAGKAKAVESGVAASTGEILVFSDAGGRLASDAITALAARFDDPDVGGVAGDQRYDRFGEDGSVQLAERTYWNFDRGLKRAEAAAGNVISGTGSLYAIRRELFEPIPPGAADDAFVSTGVILHGLRLAFAEDAVSIEPIAPSAAAEFDRKVRIMVRGLRAIWARRGLLNPARHGFYSLQLLSHKVLRRLTVLPLFVATVAAPLLWQEGIAYRLVVILEVSFLVAALLGSLLGGTKAGRLRVLSLPAYVVMVNAAAVAALWTLVRGRPIRQWERTDRADRPDPQLEPAHHPRIGPMPSTLLAAFGAAMIGLLFGAATAWRPIVGLGLAAAGLAGIAFLLRSELSTLAAIGIIYSNAAVVAVNRFGIRAAAGLVPALFLVPTLRRLIIRRERVIVTPAFIFMIAFLFAQLLSAAFAHSPVRASFRVGVFLMEGIALYFVVTNLVRSVGLLRHAVLLLFAVGAALGAIASVQSATRTYDNEYFGFAQVSEARVETGSDADDEPGIPRAAGPIGEENQFAEILLPLVPLGAVLIGSSRGPLQKVTLGVMLMLVLVGLALTFSRGTFVGLVVVVSMLVVLKVVRPAHLALLAAGVLLLFVLVPGFRGRISTVLATGETLARTSAQTEDTAILGRATEVAAAGLMFIDHPVIGVGLGNYRVHYREYANRVPFRVHSGEREPHNLYLGVAAETGIIGLVAVLGVFAATIRDLVRVRRRLGLHRPHAWYLASAFLAVVGGQLTTGMFSHFSYIRYFWLFMALAAAAALLGDEPRSPVFSAESTPRVPTRVA